MTEQESTAQPTDASSNLIAVSWQLGDDVRLIRRTVASKGEEIGRVLERVLMEAFVLGHLREVDAFLDPGRVRNRWQAFVRRDGQDDPIQMNQTFLEAKLQSNDRLLLRPLPQPMVPVESLTEDLLQQPPKTSGVLWVLLTLFAFAIAGGIALWLLRSTLWGPSAGKQSPTGKPSPTRRHVQLPAIPPPAPPEKRVVSEPQSLEPTPEPHKEAPLLATEPTLSDAGAEDADIEEDKPTPKPRRVRRLRIKTDTKRKVRRRRRRLRKAKQPKTLPVPSRKIKRRRKKPKTGVAKKLRKKGTKKLRKKGTKKLRKKGTKKLRKKGTKKRKRLPKARAVVPRQP